MADSSQKENRGRSRRNREKNLPGDFCIIGTNAGLVKRKTAKNKAKNAKTRTRGRRAPGADRGKVPRAKQRGPARAVRLAKTGQGEGGRNNTPHQLPPRTR